MTKHGRLAALLNSKKVLKDKLTVLWGQRDWPIEWEDIEPSIPIWIDFALDSKDEKVFTHDEGVALIDQMLHNVLECVELLRNE